MNICTSIFCLEKSSAYPLDQELIVLVAGDASQLASLLAIGTQ